MLINSENSFNGSVKEVETKTVSLFDRNGAVEEHLESTDYKLFDERKNLIESEHYYAEKQRVKRINAYDKKDRKIKSLFYSDGALVSKYESIYNDDGQLIEQKYFDENEDFVSNYRPVFTKEGLRIEETIYETILIEGKPIQSGFINFHITPEIRTDFSGKKVSVSKTIYDAKDKLIEASFYKKRNRLLGKIFVVYDHKERPVEITKYGNDTSWRPGELKRWQKMLFPLLDKLENVLSRFFLAYKLSRKREREKALNCFRYGAPFSQTSINYDENERMMKLVDVNFFPEHQSKTVYKYDEKGNLIEKKLTLGDDYFTDYESHEYEYDSQNNWVKKKSFYKMPIGDMTRFMERVVLTTRTIKYY